MGELELHTTQQLQLQIIDRYEKQIQLRETVQEIMTEEKPSFDRRLVTIPDLLCADTFCLLRESLPISPPAVRVLLPVHKSGATISYRLCHTVAPIIIAFYHSATLRQCISNIVGASVCPTPLNDQSSCSVLIYDRPGDHIGWHYDLNFYAGRHFTALLPLINEDISGEGPSSSNLLVRMAGEDRIVPTRPNHLVLFEGAHVFHRVTPLKAGERRVILSMTFCTDPASTPLQSAARRFKDIAYFGMKALWT